MTAWRGSASSDRQLGAIRCLTLTVLSSLLWAACSPWGGAGSGLKPTGPGDIPLLAASTCPPDAVRVGPTCVDTYEASVWSISGGEDAERQHLVEKLQAGVATTIELEAGAKLVSPAGACGCAPTEQCEPPSPFPDTFPGNGNWSEPLYAASVEGVPPTVCVTWFQAEQACALSGKRLLTNQEWQRAAAGTPDGAPCVVSSPAVGATGTSGCVSRWFVYDMVGNVWEWVADWADRATRCTTWPITPGDYGGDGSCVAGLGNGGEFSLPGARHRGGAAGDGTEAGVFAISDGNGNFTERRGTPMFANPLIGFRCAR